MVETFRGAPTRIGRVMLAVFGAPFILSALALLGAAILGNDERGEKLAMVIAAAVFSGAGLFLWAPAFPGVVNRILQSENRLVKAVRPHAPPLLMGGMVVLMGMFPVLAAVGIIPTEDSSWHAPRWVGAVAGGLFVVAGIFILTKPAVDRLEPRLKKQIAGLFPLLIVSGLAAISCWVAFGPGERQFSNSASNALVAVSWGGGELVGRIAFGLGAVALIVITIIGWWKYLTGRW
jgi:hypothetical protein